MNGKRLFWLAGTMGAGWLLLVVCLGAASGRDLPLAESPPIILDFRPPANSHDAAATTALTVTYDQPLNPATVNSATFPVQAMQRGRVPGVHTLAGSQATFQPAGPFFPGEIVQATVTTGTLNAAGQPLAEPLVWQFRTAVDWGSGIFTATGQPLAATATWYAGLGDLDGDGDLDAFLANGLGNRPNEVWFNDGRGQFADSGQRLGNSDSRGGALGDLDGDGDLDAVVANWSGQYNRVWLNDGLGTFSAGQQFDSRDGTAIGLGDLDGDGDLDVFSVNGSEQTDTIWFNDGSGHFSGNVQLLDNDAGRAVRLADLDGDGDLDAFVANRGPNRVWFNDGRGQFTNSGQALGAHRSEGLDLGDLDGDGDLDAFVANGSDPPPSQPYNRVWLNDGQGFFANSGQLLGDVPSSAIVLGDVDADGDLDAAVGNGAIPGQLWLNDGQGTFTDSGQLLSVADIRAASLGDLDGDGDLDLFLGNLAAAPGEIWLNYSEPVAGLAAGSDSPTALGQATHLTATINSGTEVSYLWDLGDGSSASGPAVSHIYPAPGVYTAVVTASNNLNSQSAGTQVFVFLEGDLFLPLVLQPHLVDLALDMSDSPDPVVAGGRLTYALTVQNLGSQATTGVVISDQLPGGVVYNAAESSPLCQESNRLVTCSLGTLAGAGSKTVLIVVDVEPAAVALLVNLATVTSQQPDGQPGNNSAGEETIVLPP
jgi:uncharacterized repeat protein (TIGR01451 family)